MSEIKSLSDYKKQQAIEKVKSWSVKYAIVGVRRIDDDLFVPDSSIVCSKEQLEEAKLNYVWYEVYELNKTTEIHKR